MAIYYNLNGTFVEITPSMFGTYSKEEIDSKVSSVYRYKGSVASADKLPTSGQTNGDVYNITAASDYGVAGMNVAWNGSEWDSLGGIDDDLNWKDL